MEDATVRTREEAEKAERLAGEKAVRSVEAMSGPTERGVRPWERRDRAAYGGVESLGVGADASAVRRARVVVHTPAPAHTDVHTQVQSQSTCCNM